MTGTCVYCKGETIKSIGQIKAWHRECRTKGRRSMRTYFKREKNAKSNIESG
jgi:hypothetical protein